MRKMLWNPNPRLLAVIVLFSLVLSACTTAPASTQAPAAPKEGTKTVIRVGTGDSGEGLNPHQQIISQFEEANKDILVQLEAVAGNDYYARLLTQVAAGACLLYTSPSPRD